MPKAYEVILGLGLITWVILIFAGLIIITMKLFNQEDVILTCPDVDMKTSHVQDGFTYVKLNATIDTKVIKTETVIKMDSAQLGIAKMSIIMFWIIMLCGIMYGLFKAFR